MQRLNDTDSSPFAFQGLRGFAPSTKSKNSAATSLKQAFPVKGVEKKSQHNVAISPYRKTVKNKLATIDNSANRDKSSRKVMDTSQSKTPVRQNDKSSSRLQ